jgi:hypothetical protein
MSEETENQSTESSTVETTVTGTTSTEDTSAETENTEAQEAEEPRIPKSRLDEVITQRKQRDERIAELEAELAAKEEKVEEKPVLTVSDEPPAGLLERDLIKWYVEKDSEAMIKRKLGMDLETAATLLGASKETAQDMARRQWGDLCKTHGLDPESEDLQYYFMSATQSGKMKPEAALKRWAEISAKPGKPEAKATVETDSVTGVMTGTKGLIAKNKQDAAKLAKEGKKVAFLSQDEILAQRKERLAQASKGG